MRVINIGGDAYLYPEGIYSMEDFVAYVNLSGSKFIRMRCLYSDNCVPPYFVREDCGTCYVNFSAVSVMEEAEVTLLSREEYDARLREVLPHCCRGCVDFDENEDDLLEGRRNYVGLDGYCPYYQAY
ncbi:MAG TPA: hypothetical protein H9684_01515 [Firmicutes bacterium]|nr:hypothetical protein [Bacillota bacterium]